jgi:hypothetical protein
VLSHCNSITFSPLSNPPYFHKTFNFQKLFPFSTQTYIIHISSNQSSTWGKTVQLAEGEDCNSFNHLYNQTSLNCKQNIQWRYFHRMLNNISQWWSHLYLFKHISCSDHHQLCLQHVQHHLLKWSWWSFLCLQHSFVHCEKHTFSTFLFTILWNRLCLQNFTMFRDGRDRHTEFIICQLLWRILIL